MGVSLPTVWRFSLAVHLSGDDNPLKDVDIASLVRGRLTSISLIALHYPPTRFRARETARRYVTDVRSFSHANAMPDGKVLFLLDATAINRN